MSHPASITAFIDRWSKAEAAERANYALFLTQLCEILAVPAPDPAGPDSAQNAYVFERAVTFQHRGGKTTTGRIDLYKRGSFVCECKQYANVAVESDDLALAIDDPTATAKKGKIARGSEAWDRAMIEAHGQADRYARSLPTDEDPPPFLLVVDVGHVIELYADFTQKGKAYLPFPDARAHRIRLADLAREEVRAKLRILWLDPLALDPAKVAAAVTREVAGHLTAKDKVIHAAALVSTLKQLHDDLDQAVADAYGWAWPLTDGEILEKVVALNAQRAAEEAKGHIRWLRPDYQKPLFAGHKQSDLGLDDQNVGGGLSPDKARKSGRKAPPTPKGRKAVWPKSIAERAKAVEAALQAAEKPVTAAELTPQFARAKAKEVAEILETLAALGRAHEGDTKGTYVR